VSVYSPTSDTQIWKFCIHAFRLFTCNMFTCSRKTSMIKIKQPCCLVKKNILVMNIHANTKREWTEKIFSRGKYIRIPLSTSLNTASSSVTEYIGWHSHIYPMSLAVCRSRADTATLKPVLSISVIFSGLLDVTILHFPNDFPPITVDGHHLCMIVLFPDTYIFKYPGITLHIKLNCIMNFIVVLVAYDVIIS
jgi:hypothetical protein